MPFKLGDVVYLKSGSPAMTVSGLTESGFVVCTRFADDHDDFLTAYLEPEMLTDEFFDDFEAADEDDDDDQWTNDMVALYGRSGG